ncbi:MAG: hypothetical protein V4590_07140 [Bacteroidota bacterium]
MKKATNIFTACILSLSILIGYTGVPVYKMVCLEDGHVSISITNDDASCHHEAETKDCCKPIPKQLPEPEGCCDFDNSFLQLEESSLVYTPQTATGHTLNATLVLYAPPKVIAPLTHTPSEKAPAPPLLCRKQHQQSRTQNFRI